MKYASGFLLICPTTRRLLLGLRSESMPVWSTFGGMVESYESPYQGALRELIEETKLVEGIDYKSVSNRPICKKRYNNFEYRCYVGICDREVSPTLNYEHLEFGWFEIDKIPTNINFGLRDVLLDVDVMRRINAYFYHS